MGGHAVGEVDCQAGVFGEVMSDINAEDFCASCGRASSQSLLIISGNCFLCEKCYDDAESYWFGDNEGEP